MTTAEVTLKTDIRIVSLSNINLLLHWLTDRERGGVVLIISINKTGRLAVTGLLAACHIMPLVNERSRARGLRPDHPPPQTELDPSRLPVNSLHCEDQENCKVLQTVISINRHLLDCIAQVKLILLCNSCHFRKRSELKLDNSPPINWIRARKVFKLDLNGTFVRRIKEEVGPFVMYSNNL